MDGTRFIKSFDDYRMSSMVETRRHLRAIHWHIDQPTPTEFTATLPNDTYLVCAHISGHIDWEARLPDRSYRAPARPGTLNMGRPGDDAWVRYQEARADFVHFHLPVEVIAEYLEDTSMEWSRLEIIDAQNAHDPVIDRLARQAMAAMHAGATSLMKIESIGLAVAAQLIDRWSNHATSSGDRLRRPALPTVHAPDWRIRRTLEHIEETLHADIGLTDLAREVGLSTSQYLRIFRASMGCTPYAWVTRRKVERAAALLAASPKGITEIAAELNFSSSQQFATVFKRVMGLPPTVYRQGMRGRT